MTETFPGYYLAGDYQEQKTPETEHPADSESQADDLTVVDPESLREDGGVVSGRMGNLARLAGFQPDKNNAAPEADSSGGQDKARADLLAALRGGGKESPDASSQASEKAVKTGESDDQPEANTQGNEQQSEMNSEQLRELIDNCLQAAQSAREIG